jgi:hypothetical protein
MQRESVRRRGVVAVVAVAVAAAFLTVSPATAATPHATATTAHSVHSAAVAARPAATAPAVKANDVYIRDTTSDVGNEPSGSLPVWESPDIWVCHTTAPCSGVDPVVGSVNTINVRLNNVGAYSVAGDVNLYYTAMGASALWPSGWVTIGTLGNVSVPPGGLTVQVPWYSVPGPGHFCLLARFVSTVDPMTFPEGPDTLTNTVNNNNIAWHNVDTVALNTGKPSVLPFTLTDTTEGAESTDLVFTAPKGPFVGPGRLTVDLGQTLAQRWKASGQQGVGVSQLDGTQVQILDPKNAQIQGLTVQPGESLQTQLTFVANSPVTAAVQVDETDRQHKDLGGVEYDLSTNPDSTQ